MSGFVTVAAFRELGHNASRMWHSMALHAGRHHLMPFLMAGCACQGLVLRLAGAKEVEDILVAYSAIL